VSFEEMIRETSETNKSKIVLALDLEDPDPNTLLQRSSQILQQSGEYVCAVKINRQLVLALGLRNGVDKLVKMAHESSLPTIMDAKLNDVGHTNEFMLRSYIDAGFDAVIASPLVGWEGGLDSVFRLATSRGKAVILLVYMSNPGADALYSLRTVSAIGKPRQMFELFAEMAVEWKANGVVVGATKPEIILRVRQLAGRDMAIFSPGVGAQGGDARRAIEAGSDYLIVGRSIYANPNPSAAARRYRDMLV
jgi:orotidine-5'-phosphate decarboxylase